MKTGDAKPLAEAGVPEAELAFLASRWITSVDELVAAEAALQASSRQLKAPAERGGALSRIAGAARATLPPERAAQLSKAGAGGRLGCLVEPQAVEDFKRHGRVRPVAARPAGAFEAKLPPAVRLMDKMPPVRNQGERGTCVAFGTVALREYLCGGKPDLSEQFLYWACKELDGVPEPGTYVSTAMTALAEYGVCEESAWPYNPRQEGSEGQGPPPASVSEEAKAYRLPSARTVEPNLVVHYKNVLAGAAGMPVTFAVLVFDSWYLSAETNRTGKITLPFPDEEPAGGHAMCVVGYADDDDVPGGGYFIVRNSWGARWASDSPEAPGHALVPYEYVERYAMEAFTGPATKATAAPGEPDGERARHTKVLDREARDIHHKLLPAGARVIFDPLFPTKIVAETDGAWAAFVANDCALVPETRRSRYVGDVSAVAAEVREQFSSAQAAKQRFLAAIDENLKTAVHEPFPEVHAPALYGWLPWEPKIREVKLVADLTEGLAAELAACSGLPEGLPLPDGWKSILQKSNSLCVYAVEGIAAQAHVVVAFVSPLALAKDKPPAVGVPDGSALEAVRSAYDRWAAQSAGGKPTFTFLSIGAPVDWAEDVRGIASGDCWVVFSASAPKDRWISRKPRGYGDRFSLTNFMDRLLPETRKERNSRIKEFIDEYLEWYEGNLTIEFLQGRMAESEAGTYYRRSSIRDAMAAMQDRSKYRVYKVKGDFAIDRQTGLRGVKLRPASGAGRKFWYMSATALGFLIPNAVYQVASYGAVHTPINLSALMLSPFTGYISALLMKPLSRLKDEKE